MACPGVIVVLHLEIGGDMTVPQLRQPGNCLADI
jgi:hypothetical protein